MNNNKQNVNGQLQRMKDLMNFRVNESKAPAYNSVEYSKVGADGRRYGIIREGSSYYIKVAGNPNVAVIAENFNYIGGFRNRKANQFESFAQAQRFFQEKLQDINESRCEGVKKVITESWDLSRNKELVAESTDKMQAEINRQRQIMANTIALMEGEKKSEFKPVIPADQSKNGGDKSKAKKAEDVVKDYNGKPIKCNGGDCFTEKPAGGAMHNSDNQNNPTPGTNKVGKGKPFGKSVKESTDTPLSSRENPDYMDMSHGTEVGDTAPFDDAEGRDIDDAEGTSKTGEMHNGVVKEAVDNLEEPEEDETELDDVDGAELDDEEAVEDDELGGPIEPEVPVDGGDVIEPEADGGMMTLLQSINDKLSQLVDNEKYGDEDLYDDEDGDLPEGGDELPEGGDELPEDDEMPEDDEEFDEVVESRSYRNMRRINEEQRLDYFGKHPAYQKRVMSLPSNAHQEFDGYYDMNDDSVKSEAPYGSQIGSGAPFEVDIEEVENAIAEEINRQLKKKRL